MCRNKTSNKEENPISVTLRSTLKARTSEENDSAEQTRFIPIGKNGRSQITGATCPSIETHFVCPKSNPCRCRGECTISGNKITKKSEKNDKIQEEMELKIQNWREKSNCLEQLILKLRNENNACDRKRFNKTIIFSV